MRLLLEFRLWATSADEFLLLQRFRIRNGQEKVWVFFILFSSVTHPVTEISFRDQNLHLFCNKCRLLFQGLKRLQSWSKLKISCTWTCFNLGFLHLPLWPQSSSSPSIIVAQSRPYDWDGVWTRWYIYTYIYMMEHWWSGTFMVKQILNSWYGRYVFVVSVFQWVHCICFVFFIYIYIFYI